MSLIHRPLPPLGRSARKQRDDRIFVVASEDTYAVTQYFEHVQFRRVRVITLPTTDNRADPGSVVARLKAAFADTQERKNIQEGDEFWVLIDTDHHFQPNHVGGTVQALKEAERQGFDVAVSNPGFAVWLLLHHDEPQRGQNYANAAAVESRLHDLIGSPCKSSVPPLLHCDPAPRRHPPGPRPGGGSR